jgi:hypothetical protein
MSVYPHDGINDFCQHGHRPGVLPARRVNVGTGLDGITKWHLCDGSRPQTSQVLGSQAATVSAW